MKELQYLICGDCSLTIEFGNEINENINNSIGNYNNLIKSSNINGIIETVPTFRSLMIHYDPSIIEYNILVNTLKNLSLNIDNTITTKKRIIEIPVCYGGNFGIDLEYVSVYTKLSPKEVIELHSSKNYLIYMLGFLPGFAYLGGMDDRLITPRLKNPRTSINAGSVGIGGKQTGIYPLSSPAGWQLIGTTPLKPYDPNRKIPILYEAGDYIKFKPISEKDFYEIKDLVDKGEYKWE